MHVPGTRMNHQDPRQTAHIQRARSLVRRGGLTLAAIGIAGVALYLAAAYWDEAEEAASYISAVPAALRGEPRQFTQNIERITLPSGVRLERLSYQMQSTQRFGNIYADTALTPQERACVTEQVIQGLNAPNPAAVVARMNSPEVTRSLQSAVAERCRFTSGGGATISFVLVMSVVFPPGLANAPIPEGCFAIGSAHPVTCVGNYALQMPRAEPR